MKKFAIVLAAGKGTRMKSDLPKVMHPLSGVPMLELLVRKLERLQFDDIFIVTGHASHIIESHFGESRVTFIKQEQQLGTAHAVQQVAPYLKGEKGVTLVLTGDSPLLSQETLEKMVTQAVATPGLVLTTSQPIPTGYGRIVRNEDGTVGKIVEEKDASETERRITEVNTGAFAFHTDLLFTHIFSIKNTNKQSEYYLTDIVEVFQTNSLPFSYLFTENSLETVGINDRYQLSQAEEYHQSLIKKRHMLNGVRFILPETSFIEEDVTIGENVLIEPNVSLKGNTLVGSFSTVGTGSLLSNTIIGENVSIRQSYVYDSIIRDHAKLGPFAHVRPDSVIDEKVKIGNFVEVKKSVIGKGSSISHLSYIGDADLGEQVNIGCGAITVNYDGRNKHKTIIEDAAFVGCNVNLIAPVTVGANSIVAAGSTITDDIPPNTLAIAREKQCNKEGYSLNTTN